MHRLTSFGEQLATTSRTRTIAAVARLVRVDSNRLVYARESLAWTQQELADTAGVGRITISNLERGLVQPRMPTLRKIAKALRVKPADLLVRDEGGQA